jgi:hypothetical protein
MEITQTKIFDEYLADDVHKVQPILMWNLSLTHSYHQNELEQELNRDDIWIPESHHKNLRCRYNHTSKRLNDFINEFSKLKNEFIEESYNTNEHTVGHYWYKGKEHYLKNSTFSPTVYKDMPGFEMAPHIDNYHIMVQTIINLTDNGDVGTEFYSPSKEYPYYAGNGKVNTGTAFFNTHGSVHGIRNIDKPRFILYTAVYITQ